MKTKILSLAVITDTNKIILFSGIVKSLITVFIRNDTPARRSMSNFERRISFERVERCGHCWSSFKVKEEEIIARDEDQLRNEAF